MIDEPAPAGGDAPDPSRDRARIEPPTTRKKTDLLPILYIIGFLVLAGAVYYLWQNPPESHLAAQDAGKVDTMQAQLASMHDAIGKLEQQKPAAAGPTTAEFQQLQQQVSALANKPNASADQIQQLQQQVNTLANKPTATPDQLALLTQQVQGLLKQEPDLRPLQQRIDALEKRPAFDPASLDPKFNQINDQLKQLAAKTDAADTKLSQSLTTLQGRVDELEKQQKTIGQRAQLATRLQGAAAALAAGQKLGPIQGAPPALARFETEAPPTEASLHASFDKYAAAAQAANQPVIDENQDFGGRLWARAQRAVTVRQGDRVLVGDPIAGVLAHARSSLDDGDLAGAVDALKALTGPAATAMQPWIDKARSLLDARAAIATMAAG